MVPRCSAVKSAEKLRSQDQCGDPYRSDGWSASARAAGARRTDCITSRFQLRTTSLYARELPLATVWAGFPATGDATNWEKRYILVSFVGK